MTDSKNEEELLYDALETNNINYLLQAILEGLDINYKFANGASLLHQIFALRKIDLAQNLILLGCDINCIDNYGRSPLHYATRSGFIEGSNLLTLLGANLNIQDHKKRTPLMHAIKFKQMLIVKMLLNRGGDNEIEDNHGYNSLLWAVKHLTPEELKEMMKGENEESLAKAITEAIEEKKNQNEKIEVNSTLLENQNKEEEDNNQDDETVESVNYLKEMFNKNKDHKNVSSFDNDLYKRNLTEKASEEGFSYQIATPDDVIPEKKEIIKGLQNSTETNSKDDKKIISGKQDNISQDRNVKNIVNDKSSNNSSDVQNITDKKTSRDELADYEIKSSISTSKKESETIMIKGQDAKSYEESTYSISGKDDKQNSNEIQEVKRGELDYSSLSNSGKDEIKRGELDITTLNREPDHIRISSSTNEQINSNEVLKIKRPELEYEVIKENEITRIKSNSSTEDENDSKDFMRVSSTQTDSTESDFMKVTSKKTEEANGDQESANTIHLKKVKYLRDGYKDEIKDEYGVIRRTDKTVEDDILGTLSSNDRVIKQEYGEIHTTDKTVAPSYEVKEIKHPQVTSKNNDSFNFTRKKIEDSPTSANEQSNKEFTYTHTVTKDEVPERPTSDSTPKSSSDNKESDTYRISGTKNGDIDKDLMKIKSSPHAPSEDDKMTVKSLPSTKKEEDSDNFTINKHEQEYNERQEIKHLKKSDEDHEDLSHEEQEEIKEVSDPNIKNPKGQTLAWLASEKGQVAMLKKLILMGADYEMKDLKGVSCLMIAAINGHTAIVEYLSHKVRNIDEKNMEGQTALSLAIENDRVDSAKFLIDNGASVDTKIKGNTLLMHAASVGALNTIKLLIMMGLDPNEKNFRGKTAVDLAKLAKNKKVYMLLAKIAESRKDQKK